MSKNLYSKYRPNKLEDIVGQDHIKKYFTNAIKYDRFSHAYLLSGIRGVGKTTIARIIAMMVNCDEAPSIDYNIESDICQSIIKKQCPDVIEMDAASNTSIEDIREIRNHTRSKPILGKKKVFIIDEIHCLAAKASSAILKTLEEPPEHCVFILATTEPQNIINTIVSRCIKLDLKNISIKDIENRLKYICDNEKIKYDNESIHIIAKQGNGSLRDAISSLETIISECNENLTKVEVENYLGSNGQEFWINLLKEMLKGNKSNVLEMLNNAINSGLSPEKILFTLLDHNHDMYICKSIGHYNNTYVEEKIKERWEKAIEIIDIDKFKRIDFLLLKYSCNIRNTPRQDIMLESCLMEIIDNIKLKKN